MGPTETDSPATGSRALAITALSLGCAGVLTCIAAPLGVLLGIMAIVLGGTALALRKPGRGMAWGGIGTGVAAVVLSVGMVLALLPALAQARSVARMTMSMSNAKQIGMGLSMYATDNKGVLPEPGADLSARLSAYLPGGRVFVTPNDPAAAPGYVYLSPGRGLSDVAPDRIVLHENLAVDALAYAVLFADGRVEAMNKEELERKLAAQTGK